MSVVGKLKPVANNVTGELEGYICTLRLNLNIRLIKVAKSVNPNAPDYKIVAWGDKGVEAIIGAGWIKRMKKVGREDEEFITLTIDDPSFPQPLNVAAFKVANSDELEITFRRRQESAA
jgi:uncharacterized protein (DUF736 family)